MKISKIYIKNFKWVKDKRIINLDNKITFLTWPNWFWKTTIFDIIELCLTWKLHRIVENSGVTKDSADYKKPFYQNTEWEDVIIKVLIEKENTSERLVIVKHFNEKYIEDKWSKTKYKATDFDSLRTYTESVEDFDKDVFIPNKSNTLNDKKISDFFWFNNNERLNKLYLLYNYLQQEETTYFLKKSESDRKSDFDFLFKTEDEAKLRNKVKNFHENINIIYWVLETECKNKENIINGRKNKLIEENPVNYSPFFEEDIPRIHDIIFDAENPFQKKSTEEREQAKSECNIKINNLRYFLNNFDYEEYKKQELKNKIDKIEKDDKSIRYFVLQNFLKREEYDKLEDLNKIYEYSKKPKHIDYLIFEEIVNNDAKIQEIKRKSQLYDLSVSNDTDIFTYLIMEDYLKNTNYLSEGEKYLQLKTILWTDGFIDFFLLQKFKTDYFQIEIEHHIYDFIINNEKSIDILLLRNFYTRDTAGISKFESLSKVNTIVNKLKEFKLFTHLNEKIKHFIEVFNLLWAENEDLLSSFKNSIKRRKELEKDVGENEQIIASLNEIRKNLVNSYRRDLDWKIMNFDNKCLLCGTHMVWDTHWDDGNLKIIENFKIFEEAVKTRTDEIKKITSSRNTELDKNQEDIIKIIDRLYILIDSYIEENNESIALYEKLSQILTQDIFDKNSHHIQNIDSEYLVTNNDTISVGEFGVYESKKEVLKERLLQKNIVWNKLYPDIKKIMNYSYDYIDTKELKILLDSNNIDYSLSKDAFNTEYYSELKYKTINHIKNKIQAFDFSLFEYLKKSQNIWIDNAYIKYIQWILWDSLFQFKLTSNNNLSIVAINDNREKLIAHIREKYYPYKFLTNKLDGIIEYKDSVNKKIIADLGNFLTTNKILFKIKDNLGDYSESLLIDLYEELRTKMVELLKDKIDLFKDLKDVKENMKEDVIKNNLWFLNSLENVNIKSYILTDIKNYNEPFRNYAEVRKILGDTSLGLKIEQAKLWWEHRMMINDIFKWDSILVLKYQGKKELLDEKLKYISYKYYEISNNEILKDEQKLSTLKDRLNKLWEMRSDAEKLKGIYIKEIDEYKSDIIKKIEVPFFIYTAKIIQNYQQWIWIFIVYEREKSIRFLTDWESNHDAIHHLSSWQLAVVSIAFTFAVNKAFNISNDLKFINIDDPIQEMDALNIHSFTELIRHSFMDYNIVLSTHNDENAYFMKYKIEKINWKNSTWLINVQNEFFSTTKKEIDNPTDTI